MSSPDLQNRKDVTGNNSAVFSHINGIVTYVAVLPVGSVNANSTAKVELTGAAGTDEIKEATACNVRARLVSMTDRTHFTCGRSNTVKVTIAGADSSDTFQVVIHVV